MEATSNPPSPVPAVGVFADHAQARAGIEALEAAGIPGHTISVLARVPSEVWSLVRETGADRRAEEATLRHPLGDLAAWLAGIGATLPGFGPIAGTGTLGLEVARSGSSRGSVTGALVGLGVPVDDAAKYEEQMFAGHILIVVHDGKQVAKAQDILGRRAAE
jgi:hypothetical protein